MLRWVCGMNDDADVKQTGNHSQQGNTGVPLQPAQPYGSTNKEVEPGPGSEFPTPSTPELKLSREVEQAGGRVSREHPRLTPVERPAAIKPAGEAVPTSPLPPVVKFSASDEAIDEALKAPPTTSRRFWSELADLIRKRLKEGFVRRGG